MSPLFSTLRILGVTAGAIGLGILAMRAVGSPRVLHRAWICDGAGRCRFCCEERRLRDLGVGR